VLVYLLHLRAHIETHVLPVGVVVDVVVSDTMTATWVSQLAGLFSDWILVLLLGKYVQLSVQGRLETGFRLDSSGEHWLEYVYISRGFQFRHR
jgi:hypothetical protein